MKIYISYLLIVNIITFFMYGVDKFASVLHIRRIPERILLNDSIFGGVYGAILGMFIFHHKIRKKVFIRVNISCFVIHTIFNFILWRNLWI